MQWGQHGRTPPRSVNWEWWSVMVIQSRCLCTLPRLLNWAHGCCPDDQHTQGAQNLDLISSWWTTGQQPLPSPKCPIDCSLHLAVAVESCEIAVPCLVHWNKQKCARCIKMASLPRVLKTCSDVDFFRRWHSRDHCRLPEGTSGRSSNACRNTNRRRSSNADKTGQVCCETGYVCRYASRVERGHCCRSWAPSRDLDQERPRARRSQGRLLYDERLRLLPRRSGAQDCHTTAGCRPTGLVHERGRHREVVEWGPREAGAVTAEAA